ncbi:MAG TPA: DUF4350 domain-containing protein [Gemmataceae bacterium]|jgi:hypothetical protein|nr:DUF4350 domain-containing protein [Gemmataceae bacterium]
MMGTRCLYLFALVALALLPRAGFAQVDAEALARDTHIFRRLFHNQGCKPIILLSKLTEDPPETVLVVLGDRAILRNIPLLDYLRGGGSVLIASDRQVERDDLSLFGLDLVGIGRRFVHVEAKEGYHELPDCPFVVPTHDGPPLFKIGEETLDKVATNKSGYLIAGNTPLKVIARFSPQANYGTHRVDNDPAGLIFAMGAEIGAGRVLIMADHSVFINAMLWQNDNQNLDFAFNCVDWLTEHGRRQRVFFSDEGVKRTTFELPLKEIPAPPLPPPEVLVAAFDQVMAGLERENRFNNLIAQLSEGMSQRRVITLTILSLSCLMGLFALHRLTSAKHRRETGIVPLTATVESLHLGQPIHELRTQSLAKQDNYWEAAHELAIDIFEPILATAGPGSRLQVDFAGSFWERRAWRRQVRAVWRLAVDPKPRRWTRRQWLRLHGLDQVLRHEIASGTIAFVPASTTLLPAGSQSALPKIHSAR